MAKEPKLIVVGGRNDVVHQNPRIAPCELEILPALGPQTLQGRVERIVLFIDLEHDHDGVKGRDEKADGPGEPVHITL